MLGLLRAFWAAFGDVSTPGKRGRQLLVENLSASQLQQYGERRFFDVIGGQTARRYRLHDINTINVDELDADGRCVKRLCFQPEGVLVMGDVLQAQKLALELYELAALAIANAYPRRLL